MLGEELLGEEEALEALRAALDPDRESEPDTSCPIKSSKFKHQKSVDLSVGGEIGGLSSPHLDEIEVVELDSSN